MTLVEQPAQIRPATALDEDQLAQIYLDCRLRTFTWIEPTLFVLSDFKTDTEGEDIFVAHEEEQLFGFISIWRPDRFIHHLFVASDMTRTGIGSLLLAHGVAYAGLPARLKCVVRNSAACLFYEAHGWKIESTNPNGPMGPYHTYVLDEIGWS